MGMGAYRRRRRLLAPRASRSVAHYERLVCHVLGHRSLPAHREPLEEICASRSAGLCSIRGRAAHIYCGACRRGGLAPPTVSAPRTNDRCNCGGHICAVSRFLAVARTRSEEHTSELQSLTNLVC